MMTAIDTLLQAFLAFCLVGHPLPDRINGERYTVTVYTCPLVKPDGVFYLYRHQCPHPDESHAVALLMPGGGGWALNAFGGVDPAYMEGRLLAVYRPPCQLEPGPPVAP